LIIQGDSWVMGIFTGYVFLGYVIKKVDINMCPIFDGYGVLDG